MSMNQSTINQTNKKINQQTSKQSINQTLTNKWYEETKE